MNTRGVAGALSLCSWLVLAGCRGDATTAEPPGPGGAGGTSGTGSAGAGGAGGHGGAVDKAALCVQSEAELGTSLTSAFGRLDGTVLAVVGPTDTECFLPNDDHVVLQVLWNGQAYRMVISVLSTYGDPDVAYLLAPTAPAGLVWQEGWHTGVGLDYVTDLGLHAGDFAPVPMLALAAEVADAITIGQTVSVYATSDGFPSSAHLIHRNGNGADGAVVLDPESATPRVMAFHFANQTF